MWLLNPPDGRKRTSFLRGTVAEILSKDIVTGLLLCRRDRLLAVMHGTLNARDEEQAVPEDDRRGAAYHAAEVLHERSSHAGVI